MKIKIDPEKKISLYMSEFDEMRNVLDGTIQNTLRQMARKDMNTAAIGLKIDIRLLKTVVKDDNAQTGSREQVTPDIGYKIASVIQDKDDVKGDVIRRGSGKEILTDGLNFYLVPDEEASGQLSMFNSWDEFAEEAEHDE